MLNNQTTNKEKPFIKLWRNRWKCSALTYHPYKRGFQDLAVRGKGSLLVIKAERIKNDPMVVGSQATSSTGIQLRFLAISTDYRGNAFAKLFEKSLAAITGVSLLPIIFTHADPTMTPSASAPTCAACSGVPIPNPTHTGTDV